MRIGDRMERVSTGFQRTTVLRVAGMVAGTLLFAMVFAGGAHAGGDPAQASSAAAPSVSQGTATEFIVAPYFLLPTMSGSATVRGVAVDVDLGPGEIFENLKFGFMGYVEARRGQWGFAFDTMYMNLEKEATFSGVLGDGGATLGVQQGMYELTGIYGAADWVDVVFGVRINDISADFNGLRLPITGEASHVWADPIVGARMFVPDLGNWRLGVRIDTGGFGVGSSYAVQIFPTLGYDISPRFTLAGGFRFLKMKYETGDGAELFVYDIATYGLVLGVVFRFGG